MSVAYKILIDTNVFIGLEDAKEVSPDLATMQQLCGQHSVRIFVHEAAFADISRDKDIVRRKISLSKVDKFEQLKKIPLPQIAALETRFGTIGKPNDEVDVAVLYALDLGAVDFLVTQDQGIHTRAKHVPSGLADRVLTVADMVAWLQTTFEPRTVRLPLVEELPAHAIELTDDIFDSLREGYPGFDQWWREKCVAAHRLCWAATIDSELAGLVVRKDETQGEANTAHPGPKILKICTFKVKPKFRGEKLGELLLKQVLWFSQRNAYDLVYLTTFREQVELIQVLEYFGFRAEGTTDLGERVYEKPLLRTILIPSDGDNLFNLARQQYPRFVTRPPAQAYCVPIRGEYHNILFPEVATSVQLELFAGVSASSVRAPRMPGNTIRKVYVCRAQLNGPSPGSILLFYRSKSPGYFESQTVTSIGVVERVSDASSLEDLVRLTAKRSVYGMPQLDGFGASENRPVKVIDFLLMGHFEPPIGLSELLKADVLSGPPQSICRVRNFELVRDHMTFGFAV